MHLSQSKSEQIKRRDNACSIFCAIFFWKTFVPFVKSRCVWAAEFQASSYLWTVTGIFGMHFSQRSKSPSSFLFSQSLSPSYTKEKRRNSWNFPFLLFIFLVKNPTGMMCVQCFFLTFRGEAAWCEKKRKFVIDCTFLYVVAIVYGNSWVGTEQKKKIMTEWGYILNLVAAP